MTTSASDITLVRDAIHNPAEPRHFMRLAYPSHVITASLDGVEIARSTRAIKLKEVGRDIYDPAIYFPRDDVDMDKLTPIDKSTHCPLKGDAQYFDGDIAGRHHAEVAWSYNRTLSIAAVITDYIAFYPQRVQIVEHSVSAVDA
jgi:uncharacterized protein (DUF427 family)